MVLETVHLATAHAIDGIADGMGTSCEVTQETLIEGTCWKGKATSWAKSNEMMDLRDLSCMY